MDVGTENYDPVDVRPSATIHFNTDDPSIQISARDDDKSRKRAADFIRLLHMAIAKDAPDEQN